MDIANVKVGILGGGQLGKMLNYYGNHWHLPLFNLDKSENFPAGINAYHFTEGDFKNYDDVVAFGKEMDVITIEIEHVNIEALQYLESIGKIVHPCSEALITIKDKFLQNEFYAAHSLPTPEYKSFASRSDLLTSIQSHDTKLPLVQKTRGEGYDGRGVKVVDSMKDLSDLLEGPCIVETKTRIAKELAVIVARNDDGQVVCYDPVEMVFNDNNILEYLYTPANVSVDIQASLLKYAKSIIELYKISGLLAIEFFLDTDHQLWVNEVAPRPHNSGHHTIENAVTSQFEQHLRGILNLPLGDTTMLQPAAMINILGEEGYEGKPYYQGIEEVFKIPNVHVHLYGKPETRPHRKMGHITVCGNDRSEIEEKIKKISKIFKVISK
ncbi:5-(carboxyamino)imidazole ribonucleotide synthase [Membranihabitans marinus]|uniref:5-(carboxyamino)imidazole ribonucleotide synthase n=1 Tax=Membranihabitans marinus TaxID=1227546 RepID=UPI001F026C03|nr:5-(carboxyamino)imidazole ribonucleotide synthase [Membranihabitans marinus]